MDQGNYLPPPSPVQSRGNSLLVGLFLFALGYFVASTCLMLILNLAGWMDAFRGFSDGSRSDETACMVFRLAQGLFLILWLAVPSFFWAGMHGNPIDHLKLRGAPDYKIVFLAIAALLMAIPFVEFLAIRPQQLDLPESMKNLENWLHEQGQDSMTSVQNLMSDTSTKGLIANIFFLSVPPAIAEELFFRGFLQQSLGRFMRPFLAILLTAAAFSLMHLQVLLFFPRFVLGMMLGYFFWRSGKLWVSIAGHFAFNAVNILFAFFSARGILPKEMMTDEYAFPIWTVVISAAATIALILLFKNKSATVVEIEHGLDGN